LNSGVHSRRVIFIDLGRALAVTFMLYGHTASALLAPEYQSGRWFEIWQFQRGLTSSLFLLLGGFAFSVATGRHWGSHVRFSAAVVRRVRRFALFILLGYALHLPVSRLRDFGTVPEDRWRTFLAVDVLQLVGVTLILVQLLVMASRSRRAFTSASFLLAATTVFATPVIWTVDWAAFLPLSLAAFLTPAVGSLFPLFPWMAFVLLGAGFGQVYSRWGVANLPEFARRALLLPGVGMLAAALLLRILPFALFGSGPGSVVPAEVLQRVGACLVILAVISNLSRRITRLPHVFGAVAQESLLIYFVHLCIVYGSVWNRGLVQTYGPTMPPGQTIVMVVMVIVSMVALAWYWNWWKHAHPRLAQATSYAVGAVLLYKLL
jgi:uncharacterized membrane protein